MLDPIRSWETQFVTQRRQGRDLHLPNHINRRFSNLQFFLFRDRSEDYKKRPSLDALDTFEAREELAACQKAHSDLLREAQRFDGRHGENQVLKASLAQAQQKFPVYRRTPKGRVREVTSLRDRLKEAILKAEEGESQAMSWLRAQLVAKKIALVGAKFQNLEGDISRIRLSMNMLRARKDEVAQESLEDTEVALKSLEDGRDEVVQESLEDTEVAQKSPEDGWV
ncbi:uncharacterized protein G2W53_001075 [Senna tora]|uniref:Uncharacterized protein n=1 Tax=Senna tora TaxID=362788 RepID=A0A835CL64_9FABA|nr:uncharacterized protein G2W53_001075 [Senna tora]